MKPLLRALVLIGCGSLLLGSDCMFGRPIVDDRGRYYPSDGVVSCSGTRCSDLPLYEFSLPPALADSPCAQDLPSAELDVAARAGAALAGMRFTLASERPLDVNLGSLDLRDACVVVSGPVRLTIGTGSKLTRVAMMLGPKLSEDPDANIRRAGRATPDIHLGQAELDQVSLHAIEEGEPSGSVQIEFGTCNQCEIRADSLNVIESQVHNSRLEADSLTVVGGAFDTVELAFEYGLLAGVLANDLRTAACNALSLVGATIAGRASKIGPCDCGLTSSGEKMDAGGPGDAGAVDASKADVEVADANQADAGLPDVGAADAGAADAGAADVGAPAAGPADVSKADAQPPDAGATNDGPAISVYRDAGYAVAGPSDGTCLGATISQSTFFGGMVDGKVRAENSTFRSVLFARHAVTTLDMWSTNIELSVTCEHPISIRLDKTSGIGCTSCDAEATAALCRLDRAPELTVNKCPAFRGSLPECVPPLPIRRSPPIPMPPKLGS